MLFTILCIAIFAVSLQLIAWLWGDLEEIPLTESIRAQAGGSYSTLSCGSVHYRLSGPEDGRLLVLIHGGGDSYRTWDPLIEQLQSERFRILSYDLYGMGFSDRPDVQYNLDLYQTQLFELLSKVVKSDKVDIVGFSLGAAVAAHFSAKHPDLVRTLTMIGLPGFAPLPLTHPARVLSWPIVGNYISRFSISLAKASLATRRSKEPEFIDYELEVELHTLRFAGTRRAFLKLFCCVDFGHIEYVYEAANKARVPTLVVLAEFDRITPPAAVTSLKRIMPNAQLQTIPGVYHGGAVYDKAPVLAALLRAFYVDNT